MGHPRYTCNTHAHSVLHTFTYKANKQKHSVAHLRLENNVEIWRTLDLELSDALHNTSSHPQSSWSTL